MAVSLNDDDRMYRPLKELLAISMPTAQKTHGQIIRDFGNLPPAYLEASTPGPMTGGASMILGQQFSHGVMW